MVIISNIEKMRATIVVAILLVFVPFIAIYAIMDFRADSFPVGTIGYILIGILGVSVTLFLNRRLEKKRKEKEQAEMQQ